MAGYASSTLRQAPRMVAAHLGKCCVLAWQKANVDSHVRLTEEHQGPVMNARDSVVASSTICHPQSVWRTSKGLRRLSSDSGWSSPWD